MSSVDLRSVGEQETEKWVYALCILKWLNCITIVHQRGRPAGFFTWTVCEVKLDRKIVRAYYKTSAIGWTAEQTDQRKVFRKMNSGFTERFKTSAAENLVHFTSNINEQLGYENSQIYCN
jgi:hypothetical protein